MRVSIPLAAAALLGACGGHDHPPPGTRARFDLGALAASAHDFYGLPFPNDLRRDGPGLNLAGFPNPHKSDVLDAYLATALETPGFGANAALFVAFTGPIDPASLPATGEASLAADAPVFLADLDAAPGALERIPLRFQWTSSATEFVPANVLAALPMWGVPLVPGHRHALVVTDRVKDAKGRGVAAADAMRIALGLDAPAPGTGAAIAATQPFVQWAAQRGLDLSHVALASVFTVQEMTKGAKALYDAVQGAGDPSPTALAFTGDGAQVHVFEGRFPVPNFQAGDPPYRTSGGGIVFAGGVPQVQRVESVRLLVALPKGAPPPGGFPAVLYAHGTGGSYRSVYEEGLADLFGARGIASVGMDQVLHGPRNPDCDETAPPSSYEACVGMAFFNFLNPPAGRDNPRQGAADLFQLTRMAERLVVPARLHPEGIEARLDPSRLAFMGHSQGGLTGAPFVAVEPDLRAAVLSGTSGVLALTVLERKDPVDFKALAEELVGAKASEPLGPFHPVIALLQTLAEASDTINYARNFVHAPLAGVSRSVMLTEGLLDPYAPPEGSEDLAAAAGFDIGGTAAHLGDAFEFAGGRVLALPLSDNEAAPGGAQTGVLLQYPNDGHFAVFDDPVARCRYLDFIETALSGGPARVDPCGG